MFEKVAKEVFENVRKSLEFVKLETCLPAGIKLTVSLYGAQLGSTGVLVLAVYNDDFITAAQFAENAKIVEFDDEVGPHYALQYLDDYEVIRNAFPDLDAGTALLENEEPEFLPNNNNNIHATLVADKKEPESLLDAQLENIMHAESDNGIINSIDHNTMDKLKVSLSEIELNKKEQEDAKTTTASADEIMKAKQEILSANQMEAPKAQPVANKPFIAKGKVLVNAKPAAPAPTIDITKEPPKKEKADYPFKPSNHNYNPNKKHHENNPKPIIRPAKKDDDNGGSIFGKW
jgi:hypothetical protein